MNEASNLTAKAHHCARVAFQKPQLPIRTAAQRPAEIIIVDDGSFDYSSIALEAKARLDGRHCYLALSRNFGHQIAKTSGIEASSGDAVIEVQQ